MPAGAQRTQRRKRGAQRLTSGVGGGILLLGCRGFATGQGPLRRVRKHRIGPGSPLPQLGQVARKSAVPHGNSYVAQQAAELGALHRRLPEPAAKALRIQFCEPGEGRVHQFCAHRQFSIVTHRRAAIPGAHVLADVTAEDLATHLRRKGSGMSPRFSIVR